MTERVSLAAEFEATQMVEVYTEDDGTVSLSIINLFFEAALGLRYVHAGTGSLRAVRCTGDKLHPPDRGWGKRLYFVVMGEPH